MVPSIRDRYPSIHRLVELVDDYLRSRHPEYFGDRCQHPVLELKRSKVIHDNLWGTNSFGWQELALIDSPLLQRLRGIHQTGLAYQVYPSSHHTRFEHSLGVATVASRIFDSLLLRQRGLLRDIVKAAIGDGSNELDIEKAIAKLRVELRLAALLHDTGHSLFSHSSEQVFSRLDPVEKASAELANMVGKRKGAGESIAFAVAISPAVGRLLARSKEKVSPISDPNQHDGLVDMWNVALMIVGRSRHPFLQFMADIISSGFDADKLDYLLRDATSAGLPLRYDFERYFYAVKVEEDVLADGDSELNDLYSQSSDVNPERREPTVAIKYPHFETYRLRLPSKAMNTIEQIVICKLMLFSYIYHHPKVRSAEGLLVDALNFAVAAWRRMGETDDKILCRFLDLGDSALDYPDQLTSGLAPESKDFLEQSLYRVRNRLLPREVYRIGGAVASGAERPLLADFLTSLQDREKRAETLLQLQKGIADQVLAADPTFAPSREDVVRKLGLRIDVPAAPKFEDVDELVLRGAQGAADLQLLQVFPIGQWTHAYTHYRYYVRIFGFSEYIPLLQAAAKDAMKAVIGIESDTFYKKIVRTR